jgi:hypothetical protein
MDRRTMLVIATAAFALIAYALIANLPQLMTVAFSRLAPSGANIAGPASSWPMHLLGLLAALAIVARGVFAVSQPSGKNSKHRR